MDIYIEAFRNRIGLFNSRLNFKPLKPRKQSYKSSTRTLLRIRNIRTILLLSCFLLHAANSLCNEGHQYQKFRTFASTSKPISLFYIGSQVSTSLSTVLHFSLCDVLAVHSVATVAGDQGVHLDSELMSVPVQFSIFSDNNFYARYTYGNKSSKGIKLCHWNAGSAHLENKISEIEKLISDYNPHLLGISESNLFKNHCMDNCRIKDYDLITSMTLNNEALQYSRVVVYKHNSLVVKVREDLMSDKFSSIWLEVGFPGKSKILVCNAYREWQYLAQSDHSSLDISEQLARWILFLEQWEKALETGKECIVMGDFNLDFLKFNSSDLQTHGQTYRLKPLEDELFSRVVPHGVKQCVVGATRQGTLGQADTGLDHLWTNTPEKMSQIYTKFNGSDHKVIFGVRYSKIIRNSTRYVKKRSYKNFDEKKFIEKVRDLTWWDVYQSEDVDEAVTLLTAKLNSILDIMAPVKTFQTNSRYCPWLSGKTKLLILERNKAQELLSENKTEENIKEFKRLRNEVTKELRSDKIKWQQKKLDKCNDDSGKLWKNILGWLNWCSSGSPTKLYYNGKIVTAPTKLAEIMNTFFINKVKDICQKLPNPTQDPLVTLQNIMKDRPSVFSFSCVHPDTVKKIILGLKNSKASGVDNIDTYTIKLVAEEILPAVTHIVNLSIQQAIFPSQYKIAKVIPLFKKDDPLSPKNYRPVAILCILSKVIERVVFMQIVEYMTKNDLFHPNHHGFRAYHSTATAMIQMYDSWVQAADKGELTGVCMLDMSAAFDIVDHGILLQKMKLYGFDDMAYNWVKNYLAGRTQAVYIDGSLSPFLPVDIGVPQGSILGPLFYVMFTNDLPETVLDTSNHVHWCHLTCHCEQCGGLCCFADDSTYSVSSHSQVDLQDKLNSRYSTLSSYMGNSRLKLNDDKTHLLIMTTKQRHRLLDITVKIDTPTEAIEPIKSEKLLGVYIQNDLKWNDYIINNEKSLIKQLTSRLSGLKIISSVCSFKVRLMVANGVFCSKLIFQICLLGGTEDYLLDALQVVQNKAARFVARKDRYYPVKQLLHQCGWLSVRQLVCYHSVILIHKVLQTGYPKYMHSRLSKQYPYNTRLAQSESVRMGPEFKSKLDLTEKSFMNRATVSYNKIPPNLRKISKIDAFKVQLKQWVKENIDV